MNTGPHQHGNGAISKIRVPVILFTLHESENALTYLGTHLIIAPNKF